MAQDKRRRAHRVREQLPAVETPRRGSFSFGQIVQKHLAGRNVVSTYLRATSIRVPGREPDSVPNVDVGGPSHSSAEIHPEVDAISILRFKRDSNVQYRAIRFVV